MTGSRTQMASDNIELESEVHKMTSVRANKLSRVSFPASRTSMKVSIGPSLSAAICARQSLAHSGVRREFETIHRVP